MSINPEKQMTLARSATKFYTTLLIPILSVLLQQSNLQVFHTYYIFTYLHIKSTITTMYRDNNNNNNDVWFPDI